MEHRMVSIIVPVHNVEEYLDKCISSIVKQTYKNIEVILIDDGSTDGSGKICDEYAEKDARVRVVHQKNSGVSHTRNSGIDLALGTFIQFIDSDDYVEPDITEKLVSAIGGRSELAICGYKSIAAGEHIHICPIEGIYAQREFIMHFPELLEKEIVNAIWNKLYAADTIRENNLCFLEDISLGEDLLFNLEYIKNCSYISLIKTPLYYYENTNDSSLTLRFKKDLYNNQRMLFERLREFLKENNIYTEDSREYLETLYTDRMIWCLENLFHKDCGYEKKVKQEKIIEIVNDASLKNNMQYFHKGSRHKRFVGFLIQRKLSHFIYCDIRTNIFIRKSMKSLLQFWGSKVIK